MSTDDNKLSGLSIARKKQQKVLKSLLEKAVHTKFGKEWRFDTIENYTQFAKRVPIQTYDDVEPAINKLKNGATNIYWPGAVQQYAVSSGTSGKGKHIPATAERLQSDRRFMRKIALSYFQQRPNIFRVVGKHLSIPGSVEEVNGNIIGEISGLTAQHAPGWLRVFQLADPHKLIQLSFQDKFNLLLRESIKADIKVITAAPSWILTLFQQVLDQTGKKTIKQVWPSLNLLICGGLKLANYKAQLQKLIGDESVDFIETYGASEGYIGFSDDLTKNDLKMVTDNGIFFECIPHPLPDHKASGIQKTIPLGEVEPGVPYGLVVSSNTGLWRYPLNDIIEFTNTEDLRFLVKGRVNEMLDDYGEALYIYEAREVLKKASDHFDISMCNFTIAASLKSANDIPIHHWYIQFNQPVHPDSFQKISRFIDEQLQEMNRHYAIRRETKALGPPKLSAITQADINRWLKAQGKKKAQAKLPKILKNDVEILKG